MPAKHQIQVNTIDFVHLGRLGSEVFGLNLKSGFINRIELDENEVPLGLHAYQTYRLDGIQRDRPPDASRPDVIFGGTYKLAPIATSPKKITTSIERNLLAQGMKILGGLGPSIAYAQLSGNFASTAIIQVDKHVAMERNQKSGLLGVTFPFGPSVHFFPVRDPRVIATYPNELPRLENSKEIESHLGYRPHFLLLALARVNKGYCKKVVVSVLPEP